MSETPPPTDEPPASAPAASEPPPSDPRVQAAEAARRFGRALFELTPRTPVTYVILTANVALFLVMVTIGGVGFMEPTIASLLKWGASYGPRTAGGEWWRLFTATFIHIGVIHLFFNMFVLQDVGPLVERLFGNAPYVVLYVLSGLFGAMASLWWNPSVVSAGASGAIFGVYGALIGYLIARPHSIPAASLARLQKSAILFIGYNLVYGLSIKGIDMAAHVGGLLAGLACGMALALDLTPEGAARRGPRAALVGVLGAALVVGSAVAVRGSVPDVDGEIERFGAVESRAMEIFNATVDKLRADKISGDEAANVVETEVLPPWRGARKRFQALDHVPKAHRKLVAEMLLYMQLREESWELFAAGARSDDVTKIRAFNAKNEEAEKVARRLNGKDKE